MARWKRNCTDWAPKMCAFARLSGSWCANVAWWHSKCVRAELREPNEAEMGNGKSGVGGFRYNLFWSAQERTRYLPSIECLGNIQVTRSDFMSTCSLWLRNSDLKLGTSPPGSKKLGARTCLGTQRRSVNVTYRWNMVELQFSFLQSFAAFVVYTSVVTRKLLSVLAAWLRFPAVRSIPREIFNALPKKAQRRQRFSWHLITALLHHAFQDFSRLLNASIFPLWWSLNPRPDASTLPRYSCRRTWARTCGAAITCHVHDVHDTPAVINMNISIYKSILCTVYNIYIHIIYIYMYTHLYTNTVKYTYIYEHSLRTVHVLWCLQFEDSVKAARKRTGKCGSVEKPMLARGQVQANVRFVCASFAKAKRQNAVDWVLWIASFSVGHFCLDTITFNPH